jgi:hypothetical protein
MKKNVVLKMSRADLCGLVGVCSAGGTNVSDHETVGPENLQDRRPDTVSFVKRDDYDADKDKAFGSFGNWHIHKCSARNTCVDSA